jgi:predicted ATPase
MRFMRVRLENWRNFATVDVELQNRLFIVGANASGKSNFLDALQFLHELVIPGGGFQQAIGQRDGVSQIRNLAARGRKTHIIIEVAIGEDNAIEWVYRLAFNAPNWNSPPIVVEERVTRISESSSQVIVNRPDASDKSDNARLRQTVIEQTFANQEFREIAEFFETIRYLHLVPQLIRDPERYLRREADPFGGDFLEQIASATAPSQKARLRRINEALRVAVPQLSELVLERDRRGTPHLKAKYEHWRPQGKWQTENDFSDGTLRMIGLLWALQDGDGPLLLEEPELSLHVSVVRLLPNMMQSVLRARKTKIRQLIISTHSADILQDQSIDASEILLLRSQDEGTVAILGRDDARIRAELEAGMSMAEVAEIHTKPEGIEGLASLGS